MLPEELADAQVVEELAGVGFSEVYHRHFGPQMKAAAHLLEEARDAGMELNRFLLKDVWQTRMSDSAMRAAYSEPSELVIGD